MPGTRLLTGQHSSGMPKGAAIPQSAMLFPLPIGAAGAGGVWPAAARLETAHRGHAQRLFQAQVGRLTVNES